MSSGSTFTRSRTGAASTASATCSTRSSTWSRWVAAGRPSSGSRRAVWTAWATKLDPTPATVRAEAWLSIAGGAHAIGYFPNNWSVEVGAEIARTNHEIQDLVPALVEPPDRSQCSAR